MKALAGVPSSEGIGVMQSINVVVINPSFLGVFFGTAVLSLVVGGLALAGWGRPSACFFFGGALFYLVVTSFVTMLCNVPLNNRLADRDMRGDPGTACCQPVSEPLAGRTISNQIMAGFEP